MYTKLKRWICQNVEFWGNERQEDLDELETDSCKKGSADGKVVLTWVSPERGDFCGNSWGGNEKVYRIQQQLRLEPSLALLNNVHHESYLFSQHVTIPLHPSALKAFLKL